MNANKSSLKRMSRRDLLKLSGLLAGSSVLAACAPAATPTEAPATDIPEVPTTEVLPTTAPTTVSTVEGKVVIHSHSSELSDDQMNAFMAENPGITVELMQPPALNDFSLLFAGYAAGTPPDIVRVEAPHIPQFLARKILKDLTPYFEASTAIKLDDLHEVNNYYRANSPVDVGSGRIYGMDKDWSPDFTLWIYKPAFEAAGLKPPDETTVLTYAEIAELAEQTAVFEGDRVATWGYGYFDWWMDRILMNMLAETDQSLFKDSYTRVNLVGNEEARRILSYYVDLAKKKLVASPVNPSPAWVGEDFTKGILAIEQSGYWFSGMVETDITKDNILMIPGPTWSGVRRNLTVSAVGWVMTDASPAPDAAWKVFEWYNTGEPASTRAKSGWGVPALKSQFELMPTEGEFRQQVRRTLDGEIALNTPPMQFNPFMNPSAFTDSWSKQLDQVLRDEVTLDDGIATVEKEVNAAIAEVLERVS